MVGGVDFKGTNAGDRGLGVVFWIVVHVRVVIATVMYGVICKHYFWGEGQDVLIGLQRVLVVVVINPRTFLGGVDVGGLLLGGVNGVLSYTLLCKAACKNVTSMLFHCNVVGMALSVQPSRGSAWLRTSGGEGCVVPRACVQ